MYTSSQDIDRMNLKLQTEPINWNSKHGELLEKSLVLTDDEKFYGILRSVQELRNYNHVHSTLIPGASILALYSSATIINNKYNLFQIPRAVSRKSMNILNFDSPFRLIFILKNDLFFSSKIGADHCLFSTFNICIWNLLICH